MIFSCSVQFQLWLLLLPPETAEVDGNSSPTLHNSYKISIVFARDLYANQMDTSPRTATTEFHRHLCCLQRTIKSTVKPLLIRAGFVL